MRKNAVEKNDIGPIIMITGPKHVGKTTLCKLLCNYSIREMSQLLFVDLDVNLVRFYFASYCTLTKVLIV